MHDAESEHGPPSFAGVTPAVNVCMIFCCEPRPLIAQRAYNDEMRREREKSLQLLYRNWALDMAVTSRIHGVGLKISIKSIK